MSGVKFVQDQNLKMGQRFGKTEVIKIGTSGYTVLCDCGMTVNKNRGATPPTMCKECRRVSQRHHYEETMLVTRDNTAEEDKMIKTYLKDTK